MKHADTPISVIDGARETFAFACFVADAINAGRITPSTLREKIKIDEGGHGIVFTKTFTREEIAAGARNLILMAWGTSAIATDKAMDAVFGKKFPSDASELGSARAFLYQIRCAFAHDPLNPIWAPKEPYRRIYRIMLEVPGEAGQRATRTIEFDGSLLNGRHLSGQDIGGLGGYLSLLEYCLTQTKNHPKGNVPYVPPVEN